MRPRYWRHLSSGILAPDDKTASHAVREQDGGTGGYWRQWIIGGQDRGGRVHGCSAGGPLVRWGKAKPIRTPTGVATS